MLFVTSWHCCVFSKGCQRRRKKKPRLQKREYDRKRTEEMKKNLVKLQLMREKERKKYLRKREKGVTAAKLVGQMSDREVRNIRRGWKKRSLV